MITGTIDIAELRFALNAGEREGNIVLIDIPDSKLYQTVGDAHANFDIILDTFGTPEAIADLRQHVVEGKIEGNTYYGECACLFGTLANFLKGEEPDEMSLRVWNVLESGITPAERLFLYINKNNTPEDNPVSKLVVDWIDQYTTKKG